jgi:hypothetical protein
MPTVPPGGLWRLELDTAQPLLNRRDGPSVAQGVRHDLPGRTLQVWRLDRRARRTEA